MVSPISSDRMKGKWIVQIAAVMSRTLWNEWEQPEPQRKQSKFCFEMHGYNTEQLKWFKRWHIFCSVCLFLQNMVLGAVSVWVGTDYKASPTGSWPTAFSTYFSLPTPTTIIAGLLHPSTKMASIHSDAVWLHERVQLYNHGSNKEQGEEKAERSVCNVL